MKEVSRDTDRCTIDTEPLRDQGDKLVDMSDADLIVLDDQLELLREASGIADRLAKISADSGLGVQRESILGFCGLTYSQALHDAVRAEIERRDAQLLEKAKSHLRKDIVKDADTKELLTGECNPNIRKQVIDAMASMRKPTLPATLREKVARDLRRVGD